jgi:DNA repair protein RadC
MAAPAASEERVRHVLPGSITLPRVDLSRPADIESDEPPIDRLRLRGPRSLSDAELLSLLHREDDPGVFELDAVRGLLREIGLVGVAQLDESFFYRSGWDEGPTASLLAAVELARRLARIRLPKGWLLKSPSTRPSRAPRSPRL